MLTIALALAITPLKPPPPPPATQTCPDGSVILATDRCDAPPSPPPATQTCPDGSVILASATCPAAVTVFACRSLWPAQRPSSMPANWRMELEGSTRLRLVDPSTRATFAGTMTNRGTNKVAAATLIGLGGRALDFVLIAGIAVVDDKRGNLVQMTLDGVAAPYFCTDG